MTSHKSLTFDEQSLLPSIQVTFPMLKTSFDLCAAFKSPLAFSRSWRHWTKPWFGKASWKTGVTLWHWWESKGSSWILTIPTEPMHYKRQMILKNTIHSHLFYSIPSISTMNNKWPLLNCPCVCRCIYASTSPFHPRHHRFTLNSRSVQDLRHNPSKTKTYNWKQANIVSEQVYFDRNNLVN